MAGDRGGRHQGHARILPGPQRSEGQPRQSHRQGPLGRIAQQGEGPGLAAQQAVDIGGPQIAAALSAGVRPSQGPGHQKP